MLRLFLLVVCLAAAALGLLTVMKAPEWAPWQASVLAGEYGYWLALAPLAAVLLALPYTGALASLVRIIGVIAVILLVQPCFQAWRIGQRLPAQLRAAFGAPADARLARQQAAFRIDDLFGPAPSVVPHETFAYEGHQSLDLYRAQGVRKAAPCVVVIHGGGWNNGDRGQIPTLNYQLARAGFVVADISYQLAPAAIWPAQRDDVQAALAWLKARAIEFEIDPRRFVILGRSAGGQIAEAAAYAAHDPSIRGVVALYAPADMRFAYKYGREDDILHSLALLRQFLGGPPFAAGPAYDSASGYFLASDSSPPTLLVHGKLDSLVWYLQSTRLAERLSAHRVPHYLLTLPWATHAVEYHTQGPSGQLAWFAVHWFVSAVTR